MSDRNDWLTFPYDEKRAETAKAHLLVFDGKEHWVPKSQCEIIEDDYVLLSPWIAREKGLQL